MFRRLRNGHFDPEQSSAEFERYFRGDILGGLRFEQHNG